jgi:hypothetical protein
VGNLLSRFAVYSGQYVFGYDTNAYPFKTLTWCATQCVGMPTCRFFEFDSLMTGMCSISSAEISIILSDPSLLKTQASINLFVKACA